MSGARDGTVREYHAPSVEEPVAIMRMSGKWSAAIFRSKAGSSSLWISSNASDAPLNDGMNGMRVRRDDRMRMDERDNFFGGRILKNHYFIQ